MEKKLDDHGEYFKGLGYLGMGRLLAKRNQNEEAKKMLDQAVKYAETDQIEKEAKGLLSAL